MAARGPKPKAAQLRLVDGTHRPARHGQAEKAKAKVDAAITSFGKLIRPAHLKGEALAAWKKFIEPAGWLDGSREAAAIAFCELWKEFRFNPQGFPSSKHGQMRAYMAELGLTDEHNRGKSDDGPKDPFFND